MYGLFITMLSLLNQEITETQGQKIGLLQFCGGCNKSVNFKCSVYKNPTRLSWFRNQQQCAFNFKQEVKKAHVVNALKASKRAAKGA